MSSCLTRQRPRWLLSTPANVWLKAIMSFVLVMTYADAQVPPAGMGPLGQVMPPPWTTQSNMATGGTKGTVTV